MASITAAFTEKTSIITTKSDRYSIMVRELENKNIMPNKLVTLKRLGVKDKVIKFDSSDIPVLQHLINVLKE
jgi:hypothetical protein